jgi:NADH-ubiquinone oxidoreductase chain 5
MSQLGMMVISIGLSSYNLALFHLINHAFYKALLFLGAGSIIHGMFDNQDLRKYGGLKSYLPLTYTIILIASLSLIAFPFMSGYYSKDFILESAFGKYNFSSISIYFIALIGASFTTLYSIKILYLTFMTKPNGSLIDYKNVHEGDIFLTLPLIILSVFSIFFGYITKDMYIGMGTDLFSDNSIFVHPTNEIVIETEFSTPIIFKILPFIITLLLSLYYVFYNENKSLSYILRNVECNKVYINIYSYFSQRLFIEKFYNEFISGNILNLGGKTTKMLDKGSIEYIGPYGLELSLVYLSKKLSKLDTGIITSYALYILSGLIIYIAI